jgi:hypothetical protein
MSTMSRIDQLAGVAAELSDAQEQSAAHASNDVHQQPKGREKQKRASARKAPHKGQGDEARKPRGRPRKYPLPPDWQTVPQHHPRPLVAVPAELALEYLQQQQGGMQAQLPAASMPFTAAQLAQHTSSPQASAPPSSSPGGGQQQAHAAPQPTALGRPESQVLSDPPQAPAAQPPVTEPPQPGSLLLSLLPLSLMPAPVPDAPAPQMAASSAASLQLHTALPPRKQARLSRMGPAMTQPGQGATEQAADAGLPEVPPGTVVKPYPGFTPGLPPRRRPEKYRSLNELALSMPTVECEHRAAAPAAAAQPPAAAAAAAQQPAAAVAELHAGGAALTSNDAEAACQGQG